MRITNVNLVKNSQCSLIQIIVRLLCIQHQGTPSPIGDTQNNDQVQVDLQLVSCRQVSHCVWWKSGEGSARIRGKGEKSWVPSRVETLRRRKNRWWYSVLEGELSFEAREPSRDRSGREGS